MVAAESIYTMIFPEQSIIPGSNRGKGGQCVVEERVDPDAQDIFGKRWDKGIRKISQRWWVCWHISAPFQLLSDGAADLCNVRKREVKGLLKASLVCKIRMAFSVDIPITRRVCQELGATSLMR